MSENIYEDMYYDLLEETNHVRKSLKLRYYDGVELPYYYAIAVQVYPCVVVCVEVPITRTCRICLLLTTANTSKWRCMVFLFVGCRQRGSQRFKKHT